MSDFDVIGHGRWPVRCTCKLHHGAIVLFVTSPTGELEKLPFESFGAALREALRLTNDARKVA